MTRPRPQRPLIVMVDTSGSMSITDIPNGPTRLQSAWQALQPQLARIDEHFVPQFFTFSSGVTELDNPQKLSAASADGKSTDIARALGKAHEASPRDDAVTLLISDGADNVSASVLDAVRDSHQKACTITVGSELAQPALMPNVAVDNVASDEDLVVGHESKIVASIQSSALANRVVDVKLAELEPDGKPLGDIQVKQLALESGSKTQPVEFTYKPASVGAHRLAVWIDPIPGERTVADNGQEFSALALDPRIKVLYVEGRLRPEYKYLNWALGHDPNIEESTLLRLQENRFAVAGTAGDQSLHGIPATLQQWKKFDVIILGDLDNSFLGASANAAIEQAVSQGTGLVMIGGQDNFAAGGYAGSPIEKTLPVQIGQSSGSQEKSEFAPQIAGDGRGHPILEGLETWFGAADATRDSAALPPLRGNVVVGAAKTGAQVLLIHPGTAGADGNPQIVLAVQRYGKGRSAAFTADTTYLWYLSLRDEGENSPYNRFWGQLVRWLASEEARNRPTLPGITGLLDKSAYRFGETARVRALVRDDKAEATAFAQVSMTLQSSIGGPKHQIPLSPVESHIGMYEARIPDSSYGVDALPAGDYIISFVATKDGKELGRQDLKFSVLPPEDEMTKVAANPALMKQIAETTGGFSGDLPGLGTMLDQLVRTDPTASMAQERTVPLANTARLMLAAFGSDPQWAGKYDLPMEGLLVAILLTVEWILRRRWELP